MNFENHNIKALYILLVVVSISGVPLCQAEISGEFLLFPQIDLVYRSELNKQSALDEDDHEVGVDFFATFEKKNFRVLGEYLLSNKEQEIERFQLGWLFKDHLFWIGRFHNPISYWNSQYHHGAYLQSSITRPAIVEFEEKGGIMPMHLGGFLAEGAFDRDEKELGYALAFGAGPEFTGELEPWDVLSPSSGTRDISATLNVYLVSDMTTSNRFGLFVNHTKIPANDINVSEIQQTSSGFYGGWESDRWRWHGSAFYVHNRFERSIGTEKGAFFNAYLQAEYELHNGWTFFGRIEGTYGEEGDAYLTLFPNFVEDRIMGGIRYDFAKQNALKLEISANQTSDDDFVQVMLQWSAMF
ncbi:MAG: hypothetical protein ACYTGA_03435 [Planctomycetota bacterium]|jgi:hypothetical protein